MTSRPTQQTKRANGTKRANEALSAIQEKRANLLRSDAANEVWKWAAIARHINVAIETEPSETFSARPEVQAAGTNHIERRGWR
jgi:hypothetical protein